MLIIIIDLHTVYIVDGIDRLKIFPATYYICSVVIKTRIVIGCAYIICHTILKGRGELKKNHVPTLFDDLALLSVSSSTISCHFITADKLFCITSKYSAFSYTTQTQN